MSFKKILVAIDHSPLTQEVFDRALAMAKANQAELMLFNCMTAEVVTSFPYGGEMGLSPRIVSQSYQVQYLRLDQQIHHMMQVLDHYCRLAHQQGVAAQSSYRIAEPGKGICQAAGRWGADLVMVGRRGRKGLSELLLGSVSNYVLHHAPCAVLVIQAENVADSLHSGAVGAKLEPSSVKDTVGSKG